ncbi:dTDP-glucose 4,6-dehydratase [Candidatus Kuenenbacteria bacterium]|nr:dTDP-glucose 4,6-dehydratase [Candidatus Kuenenbacteria bacterium]
MKILVTGGCGFIGSNFIHYWLKNHPEDEIFNLDKLTYAGRLENLKDIEGQPNYHFIHGDIVDKELVDKIMSGMEIVAHFAAESHVDNSIKDAAPFILTNLVGTQVLLEAAVKNGVKRFHHISTDEVFGSLELGSNKKFDEETLYDPSSPYSASKAGSDHLVKAYGRTFGLPVTITNCSNNYGPYQHREKFIPKIIINLLENKKVPIYGDGLNVRDWLYVEDHCRAIDLVLEKGKMGETYCIGGMNDNEDDNLTVVRKILNILGKGEEMIEFVKDRPGHDRRYAIDWGKAKKELGYEPLFGLDEYLEKTVRWYREHEWWWK